MQCGPSYVRHRAGANCPLVQRSETWFTLGPKGVWRCRTREGRIERDRFPRESVTPAVARSPASFLPSRSAAGPLQPDPRLVDIRMLPRQALALDVRQVDVQGLVELLARRRVVAALVIEAAEVRVIVADQGVVRAAQLLIQTQRLAQIFLRAFELAGSGQERAEVGVGIDQVGMSEPAEHLFIDAHGLQEPLLGC